MNMHRKKMQNHNIGVTVASFPIKKTNKTSKQRTNCKTNKNLHVQPQFNALRKF